MPSFGSFLVSLVVASAIVEAAPTTSQSSSSLKVVPNQNFKPNGPRDLANIFLKYGQAVPPHVLAASKRIAALQGRSTGTVSTNPSDTLDSHYLTQVEIGTPPQTFNLDIDTGSSDLWVFSTQLPVNQTFGQHLYDSTKSSTSKELSGASWDVSYGDGTGASGNVYTDVVNLGGVSVAGQAVEAAQDVAARFTRGDVDGLVGLAFSDSLNTVSPTQQKTWFQNAIPKLDKPVLTADLKHNKPGTYNFGFIDKSAYTGEIAYAPIDSDNGFWTFTSKGFAVGSRTFIKTRIQGVVDTGSSLLTLPNSVTSRYWTQVAGATYSVYEGGYIFPCSATLPSFSFGVGNTTVVVPGPYLNYVKLEDKANCYGGLQPSNGDGISIFGDVALKANFVVFDAGNKQIGWAAKNL